MFSFASLTHRLHAKSPQDEQPESCRIAPTSTGGGGFQRTDNVRIISHLPSLSNWRPIHLGPNLTTGDWCHVRLRLLHIGAGECHQSLRIKIPVRSVFTVPRRRRQSVCQILAHYFVVSRPHKPSRIFL